MLVKRKINHTNIKSLDSFFMMNKIIVKTIALSLFLLTSMLSYGQLQRFGLGLKASTSDFSKDYKALDFTLQFNFKKYYSIVSGLGVEQRYSTSSQYREFPLPGHTLTSKTNSINTNIPLLFRASLGNKGLVYLDLGIQYTTVSSARSVVTDSYPQGSGYPSTTYEQVNGTNGSYVHPMFGGGVTFPVVKHLMLNFDIHSVIIKNDFRPFVEGSTFYSDAYSGIRFSVGFTYQFNLKKSSSYKFHPLLEEAVKK